MKRIGMKTAAREIVMDTIVKPTSREPSRAACIGRFPISMCRTMFSSMTIASSTTKPTDRVSAISERLSRLYPNAYMTTKVPTSDIGRARLGMIVADRFRRKRKMTRTTRQRVRSSVNLTSFTESSIDSERS